MKKIICLFVCFGFAVSAFCIGHAESSNPDIQKGIELHDSVHNGDFSNVQKALKQLEPYIKTDALACAYYGSCLTLCASECSKSNPIKSLDYLKKGGKYLDKAVKLDSANTTVHLIRLENGIEVSRTSPVKRYGAISEDVDFLLDCDFTNWNDELKAETYLFCGHYKLDAGELDDALDLFEKAVTASPESEIGKTAQKMLDKYSE